MTQYTDAVDENFCVLTSGDWIIIHVAVTSVVCRRCVVFPLLSTRGLFVGFVLPRSTVTVRAMDWLFRL